MVANSNETHPHESDMAIVATAHKPPIQLVNVTWIRELGRSRPNVPNQVHYGQFLEYAMELLYIVAAVITFSLTTNVYPHCVYETVVDHRSLRYRRVYHENGLRAALSAKAIDNTVLLMLADYAYLPFLINSYQCGHLEKYSNLLILCLDKKSFEVRLLSLFHIGIGREEVPCFLRRYARRHRLTNGVFRQLRVRRVQAQSEMEAVPSRHGAGVRIQPSLHRFGSDSAQESVPCHDHVPKLRLCCATGRVHLYRILVHATNAAERRSYEVRLQSRKHDEPRRPGHPEHRDQSVLLPLGAPAVGVLSQREQLLQPVPVLLGPHGWARRGGVRARQRLLLLPQQLRAWQVRQAVPLQGDEAVLAGLGGRVQRAAQVSDRRDGRYM